MGGLSGRECDLRRVGVEVSYVYNEAFEERRARIGFGMPYETLLGVLCGGNTNTAKAADVFLGLCEIDFEATSRYMTGFITTLIQQCDSSSCELNVRQEYKHRPMDFPRPSPAQLLVWDFAAKLAANSLLYSRLRSIRGAEWFFHTVRDRPQRSEGETRNDAKTG